MAKPTQLPQWATDETNNTEPSAPQKGTGWTTNQVAVSSYFNWLGFTVYKWLEFLDPLFTSAGGFLAATNQHVTVQGTGRFKRGAMVRPLNIVDALYKNGSGINIDDLIVNDEKASVQIFPATNTFQVLIPLPLMEAERLTSVSIRVRPSPDSTGDITLKVFKVDCTGTTPSQTQLGVTQTSSGTTSQTLTASGLTETVGATGLVRYHILISLTGTWGGTSAADIWTAFYTTDVP